MSFDPDVERMGMYEAITNLNNLKLSYYRELSLIDRENNKEQYIDLLEKIAGAQLIIDGSEEDLYYASKAAEKWIKDN